MTGLRDRKKQATREALRTAALRLALEHGPENVRVEDIAAAAGVSPRTYNNYFSSREQAIVAAVTGERESRVAEQVAARPPEVRLADAVTDAVVAQYTDPGERHRDALLLLTTRPVLRAAFLRAAGDLERPLAAAISGRLGADEQIGRVLAAAVAAAVRVALETWLRPASAALGAAGVVVVTRSLPDLLREALATLAPALDAAERDSRGDARG